MALTVVHAPSGPLLVFGDEAGECLVSGTSDSRVRVKHMSEASKGHHRVGVDYDHRLALLLSFQELLPSLAHKVTNPKH